LGFTLISASATALAALDGYATIEGETQGVIAGDVDDVGHEGSIRIKGFGSSVSADFDTGTGVPTGGRQHRPIRILKNIDPASPKLLTAMDTNETLVLVTIEFIRPNSGGGEEHFYTVHLVNAHVVSILPSHSSQTDDLNVEMNETVSLTYEKMIVTWEDGAITGEADW
jgi:type VI secretion system secreted protein Hcp